MFSFAETHRFFDGELVEGVERVFDPGGFDGGLGFVDAGFYLGGCDMRYGVDYRREGGKQAKEYVKSFY